MLINRYGGEVSSLELADPTFVSVTASGYMVGNKYYSRDRCIHINNVYVDRRTGLASVFTKHAYEYAHPLKDGRQRDGGHHIRRVGLGVCLPPTIVACFGAGATANQKIEVEQIEEGWKVARHASLCAWQS